MRAKGMSLSATARVIGASVPTVSEWVKKGALSTERLTRFLSWRTSGRQSSVRGAVAAFAEQAKQACKEYKGLHKEREYAETSAGDSV